MAQIDREIGELKTDVAALRREHEAHAERVAENQELAKEAREQILTELAETKRAVTAINMQMAELRGTLRGVKWAFGVIATVGGIVGSLATKLLPVLR